MNQHREQSQLTAAEMKEWKKETSYLSYIDRIGRLSQQEQRAQPLQDTHRCPTHKSKCICLFRVNTKRLSRLSYYREFYPKLLSSYMTHRHDVDKLC